MKTGLRCVITGVALIQGDSWAAADLFDGGDFWVVNANTCVIGISTTTWIGVADYPPHYKNHITLVPDTHFWERRGVFVVHKSCAVLNEAAVKYIGAGASRGSNCGLG